METGGLFRFTRWRHLIASASSEEELVRIVREYCETIPPSELALLPGPLPVTDIRSGDEIAECAVELTKGDLRTAPSEERHLLLREMALAFNGALTRLRQIRGR